MHSSKEDKASSSEGGRLALVGNPNVGKSVIFGLLTGRYATVSNYPGTTVEVSRGPARIKGETVDVVDSPGVNTLLPMSEDERVTRDILLAEDLSGVIQVFDSKNLRRGLVISIQLVEMGLPLCMALNMYDEAGQRGISLDPAELSGTFGVEVVRTIATQGWGIEELRGAAASARPGAYKLAYPELIEVGVRMIEELLPEARISRRSIALMLLSGDATLSAWLAENLDAAKIERVGQIRKDIGESFPEPIGYIINRMRLREADRIVDRVGEREEPSKHRLSVMLGKWSMDPLIGIPILFAVLFVMYEFVGVLGAGIFADFLEETIFNAYINPWSERVVSILFPSGFLHDLIVGPYGLVTMALTYAIAIVLPIVGCFFLFFGLLEDSGYLPRLAVMVDSIFKRMGLNGKAVLPMVLGLGCDTMATMTTRILETRKERMIVTFLLALGVPCSAQLGVILGMLGSVSFTATLIWLFTVLLVMFLVGFLSSKVMPGERSDFILEIPPMRVPQMRNIMLKTVVRAEWYLKEAVPLFALGTLVLFILDKLMLLATLQVAFSPVIVGFLNLPAETTEAFLIGFLRRDYGAAGLLALQNKGLLAPVQVVVSLVTITLFVPCIANFFMIIKERGLKAAVLMGLFIFPFAVFVGGVLNFILRTLKVPL